MNEKLSLQDLVDLLSKNAKITKKEADSFYREFFQLILERIFDNDLVKIKDFGTFKLISVSSRESVNVNTGEKIEIPSHYKLSFIPDKVLKNLVNKPFSQFETILLEDGVVFETSVDNENDVSDDEVIVDSELNIKMKEGDDDIVKRVGSSINENPISINLNTKSEVKEKNTLDTEDPKLSKPQTSVNQIYPKSFVYTYTTSSSDQNTGSITLTVPKDELVIGASVSKTEDQTPSKEAFEKKEFPIELKDLPQVLVVDDDSSVELSKEITVLNKEEVINAEKDNFVESESEDKEKEQLEMSSLEDETVLDNALIKNAVSDCVELELDVDSEIETEEDVIIPVPIIERVIKNEDKEQSSKEESPKKGLKYSFSNEDPERPLFPSGEDEHISDNLNFVSLDGKPLKKGGEAVDGENEIAEPVSATHSYAGNNKPTEIRSVSFSETIDPVDIPYMDYSNPGGGSKIRKWLPVVLFFLVIVGFLAYGLVKMLKKPYDFEYNLGRTNLSLTDTLPLADEVSPQIHTTDALLDSMRKVQSGLVEDTVKPMKQEPIVSIAQKPIVKEDVEAVRASVVGDADSLTTELINAEKNGFVISDKLKFGILNKAEYHLAKNVNENRSEGLESSALANSEAKVKEASKSQYSSIRRGTTLRTMATAYYGSPDYWVYIYQANKKYIANPNNVPIGTRLLIPPLSDYGISNPKDPKAIQTAKNLEAKILRP